jgi:hypothetical protein
MRSSSSRTCARCCARNSAEGVSRSGRGTPIRVRDARARSRAGRRGRRTGRNPRGVDPSRSRDRGRFLDTSDPDPPTTSSRAQIALRGGAKAHESDARSCAWIGAIGPRPLSGLPLRGGRALRRLPRPPGPVPGRRRDAGALALALRLESRCQCGTRAPARRAPGRIRAARLGTHRAPRARARHSCGRRSQRGHSRTRVR